MYEDIAYESMLANLAVIPFTTVIFTIIPFILFLFVHLQLRNHTEITPKELNHLKICSIISSLLCILCLIPLVFIIIVTFSQLPEIDMELYFEDIFYMILIFILCSLPAIVIFFADLNNLKNIKQKVTRKNIPFNKNIIQPTTNTTYSSVKANHNNQSSPDRNQSDSKSVFDFYALILALANMPIQIYLYVTNLEEKIIWLTREEALAIGSWKGYKTKYYFPDEIKSAMVILAIIFLILSMFLIQFKGKNTSNKATWVKIINVINVIGEIILFIAINAMTS